MSDDPLVVALVNTSADGGGAETVVRTLLRGLRGLGHDASLLVGRGNPDRPHVYALPGDVGGRLAHLAAGPARVLDRWRGLETYRYPASRRMVDVLPRTPDLVHLHNLHGGYFDLRVLPGLSRRLPVAVTLHDAWLLSGHCAHSMGCPRWRTGCGDCPDLDIYPAVRRDATAANWTRKQEIFRRSRLHVATPSAWLADKVRASMLAPALADLRVIPNGIDLEVFRPVDGDPVTARGTLGLDAAQPVLLFVAGRTPDNPFKDRAMAERAATRAASTLDRDLTLVVLGGTGPDRRVGRTTVRTVPFQTDPADVAAWYRAADIYVHAARADTFPSAVLEAMACGTPVVATAVGGIPEQVRGLAFRGAGAPAASGARVAQEEGSGGGAEPTGVLVEPGDAEAMAGALAHLLADETTRRVLGRNAGRDAAARFDLDRQIGAYEAWFRAILSAWGDDG